MSPFMAMVVFAVLIGAVVFLFGIVKRKRKLILLSAPAALLLLVWFLLAGSNPNPEKEFDRLFGAGNRAVATDIQTIKPRFMDGHFLSFHMRPADFDSHIRSRFSAVELTSPPNMLLGQSLPAGWPQALENTKSVLHREIENQDVYLVYFPKQEMAYATVQYDQW